MIREEFAEPAIPRQIDFMERGCVTIRALLIFHQRGNAQIYFGKMWIGAEMIAHHHRPSRCKLSDRLVQLILFDTRTPKRCSDLADEARLITASA